MRGGSLWTQNLLPAVLIFVALMAGGTIGNPTNLVINGDFEWQVKQFDPMGNNFVTIGSTDYMPYFRVVRRGVQMMAGLVYHAPGFYNSVQGRMLCHMNTKDGPGVLHTAPMPNPRKGAPHTLRFIMADNPDGGELVKYLRVSILVNNRVSDPKPQLFQVSSPYSIQSKLDWRVKNITFVGTGESTKLQFESLAPGSFGPLIDNISVTVQTLVENGSFENVTVPQSAITGAVVISARSQDIPGWYVQYGMITWRSDVGFEPSTDRTSNFLELSAQGTAGAIGSNPFTTKPGKKYTVVFDTAANAATIPPLTGYMSASAFSYPGNKLLASRSVFISAEGYHPQNLGWTTYALQFRAHETKSFVQFSSRIKDGTWGGPLLDSILVYEVHKPGYFKHVAPTWSAGKYRKPSKWAICLTAALVMGVFGHFVS